MSRILLVIALVLAIIAAFLGFDVFSMDGDPHVLGWVATALAFYFGSILFGPYDPH